MNKLKSIYLLYSVLIFYVAYRFLLIFSYSLDLGGVEENVIYTLTNYFSGSSIYSNPEADNYSITQYSPILYIFNIGLDYLFSVKGALDYHQIYVTGRLMNLLINLTSLFLFFKLLSSKLNIDKVFSFAISVLMFFLLTRFHFSVRPDALYNLTFILILYFSLDIIEGSKDIRHFVVTCFLLTVLFLVKQSAVQIIPLYPIFFLLRKRYSCFFKFSIVFFLIFSFLLFFFHIVLGKFFLINIIGGIINELSVNNAIELFFKYFSENLIIIFFFVSSLFYFVNNKLIKYEPQIQFLVYSSVLSFITSLILTSKIGAGINYYNEFGVLVLILFSLLFSKYVINLKYVFVGLIFTVCFVNLFRSYYHEHSIDIKNINKKELWSTQEIFVKKIMPFLGGDSKILCFDRRINLLLPNYVIVPNKDIVPNQSPFDYTTLRCYFSQGKIKYLIQDKSSIKRSYMGLDFSNFKPVLTYYDLILFQYNDE